MTKIIGLTGGIGSGKTTVAKAFEELGVSVYIADARAKLILDEAETLSLLHESFGDKIFSDGKFDKLALSELVFQNPIKLQQLNAIIHPLVKKDFEKWLQSKKKYKFIIKEAAILFETGTYKDCDKIILVTAPLETRISRILKRDAISRELILKKISNQLSDEDKISKSDYIIQNTVLETTIKEVHLIFDLLNDL